MCRLKRLGAVFSIVAVIAQLFLSGVSFVHAACPPTDDNDNVVTNNPGDCPPNAYWSGLGGNDQMTNNGSLHTVSGGTGDNTLTNTSSGFAWGINGTESGTGNGTVNNYGL